jgi:hypothetical protein
VTVTASWQALGNTDVGLAVLNRRDPPVMFTLPSKTTFPLKTRSVPSPMESWPQSTQLFPMMTTVPFGTLQLLVSLQRAKDEPTGWPVVPTAASSWSTKGGSVTSTGQSARGIPW